MNWLNVNRLQISRGGHQSRGGKRRSRRRRDGKTENSQEAAILSTEVGTTVNFSTLCQVDNLHILLTQLFKSGGGRAERRGRRDGCLLRKCQGEKIISINAMPRQDEDDLKHQFLHLPCRLLLTSSKAVRKLLRRNELHGWNQRALDQEAHDQRVVANIRCVQS